MEFVAIDFETANPNYASVCAMGWATVRNGVITDRGSWLCRPPSGLEEFGPYNIRVHGITADMVADQPTFADRVPDLLARLDVGLPIVAHNAAFDIGVLQQSLATCGLSRPQNAHHCTKVWSKRLFHLPKYTLPHVCEHLGITIGRHHDAGDDAVAAAQIAIRLAESVGASTIEDLEAAASAAFRRPS
jgi:DNA polymerase-3 subunit epsilon